MKNLFFKYKELILYAICGILTTLVGWGSYVVSVDYIGFSVFAASIVSWVCGVVFAFVTNKLFVFQSYSFRPKELLKEFVSFVSCRALSGLFTIAAMIFIVDVMGWNEWLGKVAVSAISLVLNYIFSKLFIFKKAERV